MNLEKADYATIIKFGDITEFKAKLEQLGDAVENIVNTVDKSGVSLLEKSLIARKFDIAKYLLDNGAQVNVISQEGYNELHYLASNINFEGALEVARILVEREVSLSAKDKKYGNSALFMLCQEIFKKRTSEGMEFIEECLKYSEDYETPNKMGYSLRALILERGSDRLRQMME